MGTGFKASRLVCQARPSQVKGTAQLNAHQFCDTQGAPHSILKPGIVYSTPIAAIY